MPSTPRSLLRDARGVGAVEYALLLVAILLVVGGAYRLLGTTVKAQAECAANFNGPCGGPGNGTTLPPNGNASGMDPASNGSAGGAGGSSPATAGNGAPGNGAPGDGTPGNGAPGDGTSSTSGGWLSQVAEAIQNPTGPWRPATFAENNGGGAPKPFDETLAKIADGVYTDIPSVDGWTRMNKDELKAKGIDPALTSTWGWGYRAGVYTDGKGHYVVAYAGTDDAVDGVIDVGSALGIYGPDGSSMKAVTLAKKAEQAFGKDNIVFTGHSLGGDLASQAAIVGGAPAVTFNAKGTDPRLALSVAKISPSEYKSRANDVRGYVVKGEILNGMQDHSPLPGNLGHRVELAPTGGPNALGKHTMGAVLASMRVNPPWRR
ncbi:hypothetical protein [Pendulispora albinea]|uniref:Uncharacterized protein n=1 Tax=Pendulispora albinea TaxID=2741071 RepID=A0ABZ2LXZ2_9BACT